MLSHAVSDGLLNDPLLVPDHQLVITVCLLLRIFELVVRNGTSRMLTLSFTGDTRLGLVLKAPPSLFDQLHLLLSKLLQSFLLFPLDCKLFVLNLVLKEILAE